MVFTKGRCHLVFKSPMSDNYKCTVYMRVSNEIGHTPTQLQLSIAIAALE